MDETQVGTRRMLKRDRKFVIDAWLKNYNATGYGLYGMDTEVMLRCHRVIIDRLLNTYTTVVAYDPQDTRVILGFLCGDMYPSSALVHYAYVRKDLRRQGIGRLMMHNLGWTEDKPIMSTHQTRHSKYMASNLAILFNPYLLHTDFAGALSGRTTRGLKKSE
jgi:GNAT superfamily N-acetyltransferase